MTNLFIMLIVKYLIAIIVLVVIIDFAMYKLKSKFRLYKWITQKVKRLSFWFLHLLGGGVKGLWIKLRNYNKNKKAGK